MTKDHREIQRKLRILRYADETGHVAKTCLRLTLLSLPSDIQEACLAWNTAQ